MFGGPLFRAKTANPAQAYDAEKGDSAWETEMAANKKYECETENAG